MFEECVLRHGTYFLWSWAQGPQRGGKAPVTMSSMSQLMIDACLNELTNWESGKAGTQPGLRMTLMSRFREVCLSKDDKEGQKKVTDRMYDLINELIFLDDKDTEKQETDTEESSISDMEMPSATDFDWDS